MEVSVDQFNQLQQRVLLLEGGNTAYQVQLNDRLSDLNTSLTTLTHNTATSIKSMRQELGLSIDGVEEVLSGDIVNVRTTINERFDKLLDYLENWVGVGNVNMDNIKQVVGDDDASSSSSSSSGGTTGIVTSASIKQDIITLKQDVTTLNQKMDALLNYLQSWANVGNLSMQDIKDVVN